MDSNPPRKKYQIPDSWMAKRERRKFGSETFQRLQLVPEKAIFRIPRASLEILTGTFDL
jgi:hypothetical protein